jgi:chromodomain-containing protein
MKVHPIFHISLLKPTENKETKENVEAEEFEVEKILEKRTKNGLTQYKIRWTGFTEKDDTWEPEKNLDCQEKIHEFEDSLDSEDMSGGPASLAEIKQTTCYKPTESHREKQGKEGPRNFEFANPIIETQVVVRNLGLTNGGHRNLLERSIESREGFRERILSSSNRVIVLAKLST